MHRIVRLAALAVLLGALAPQLAGATSASLSKSLALATFCQDEAMLYAAPAQLAKMWPDVTSTPTVTQAKDMVTRLYSMTDSHQIGDLSIDAPTKALKAELYAVYLAGQKQLEEATFFKPGASVSHTAAADAGYTTLIEKSAATVKKFFASQASVLVGYCRDFNNTRTVDELAVQTTNGAQLIMRAHDPTTATAAILKKAAEQEGHYVLFVSLSGHGATETAHYRVAAITRMVDACTTVPSSLPPIPVSVSC
jgi:hypothetical protein